MTAGLVSPVLFTGEHVLRSLLEQIARSRAQAPADCPEPEAGCPPDPGAASVQTDLGGAGQAGVRS